MSNDKHIATIVEFYLFINKFIINIVMFKVILIFNSVILNFKVFIVLIVLMVVVINRILILIVWLLYPFLLFYLWRRIHSISMHLFTAIFFAINYAPIYRWKLLIHCLELFRVTVRHCRLWLIILWLPYKYLFLHGFTNYSLFLLFSLIVEIMQLFVLAKLVFWICFI